MLFPQNSSNLLYHTQRASVLNAYLLNEVKSPGHCASVQPRYSGHLTVPQSVLCTCLQCPHPVWAHVSDESLFRRDFEHAVHLKPSSSQLLSTGAVGTLGLPLLPCREHHEGQAYNHYQHAETQQRDGNYQPGDSLPVGLFLQRYREQRLD